MPKRIYYDIVKSKELNVAILENSHFSIGTSPYYAHQYGLAIDIYQQIQLANYKVLSPVAGEIMDIKELKAPKPKFKEGINREYLILIKNMLNQEKVYKILHVQPYVKTGDMVKIGDLLGKTIRNGYFAHWSSPHLHLEIRSINDAIRARGGRPFDLVHDRKKGEKKYIKKFKTNNSHKIPIIIHKILPEFMLGQLSEEFYLNLNGLYGIKGSIGKLNCLVDGGIPIYKKGTIIFERGYNPSISDTIYIGSSKVGKIINIRDKFGFFNCEKVQIFLNDIKIRGISLFLANFKPFIKIIPTKKSSFSFELNSQQHLTIKSNL